MNARVNDLAQYYRCPETLIQTVTREPLSDATGYFRVGSETCYGRLFEASPSVSQRDVLRDVTAGIVTENGTTYLPFDLAQVAANLRCEVYAEDWRAGALKSAISTMYYFVRPLLPVNVRKYLQRIHLRGWDKLSFPRWPVDCTIDNLFGRLLLVVLRSQNLKQIPFIWFWPDGASSCAMMTHDVEATPGRDFCKTLMDIDDAFGIKSSFQVVPEERYEVTPEFLESIRTRGFEVVIHDLNHDGGFYRSRAEFLQRAAKINAYGKKFGAQGFRAGVLYRKQLWYDALSFEYDMSVPSVAHLDPQRGGCCTVMPYFVGSILELPVTMTQDYTLFHVLSDYSIELWKKQIALIMEKHGLINFIVHPDYIESPRERSVYEELLAYLTDLRNEQGLWIAKPGEVNRWWRQRAKMELVEGAEGWEIQGEGKEQACLAFASEEDGRLVFNVQKSAKSQIHSLQ